MRKIYDEYFRIPDEGRISEKMMTARVAVMMLLMVVYLLSMSMAAYGYYTCSVTSGNNVIESANFDLKVEVKEDAGDFQLVSNSSTTNETVYRIDLKENTNYTIKITKNGTAQTGFGIVMFKRVEYHTQQLGIDVNAEDKITEEISFTVASSDGGAIEISPHWGTSYNYPGFSAKSAKYYIQSGRHVGDEIVTSTSDEEEDSTESTESTTANTEYSITTEEETTTQSSDKTTSTTESNEETKEESATEPNASETSTSSAEDSTQASSIQIQDSTDEESSQSE